MDNRCITVEAARSLGGLFRERVRLTPDAIANRQSTDGQPVWDQMTWAELAQHVARWQDALFRDGLVPGDRVAIMLGNCREWVCLDLAALSLGMVDVPLYINDRPENVAYILKDADVRLLLIADDEQWRSLQSIRDTLDELVRIVTLRPVADPGINVLWIDDWLASERKELRFEDVDPSELATIVYTSGTTGRPKGVMLSHHNILCNAGACQSVMEFGVGELFLSFLPLSHMLERTVGYYLAIMGGATVAYNRSIAQLAEDLQVLRPTGLISVPRIFERVYARIQEGLAQKKPSARKLFELTVDVGWERFEYQQGRQPWSTNLLMWPLLDKLVASRVMEKLGGRMKVAVSGGAALSPEIARTFIGLGLPLLQGYGLTETSPVLCANRPQDNIPASVGPALDDVELRISEHSELLARGPGVMHGYWNNEEATRETIDEDGWLHTGDQARIEDGHVYITGRLKEIIVLANGENVPPADMEMAIAMDPLFEQVLVIGEGMPYLVALTVLNSDHLSSSKIASSATGAGDVGLEQELLKRMGAQLSRFPGYAEIRRVATAGEPWTVENGLMTPTLKLRRHRIILHYSDMVGRLYEGHA